MGRLGSGLLVAVVLLLVALGYPAPIAIGSPNLSATQDKAKSAPPKVEPTKQPTRTAAGDSNNDTEQAAKLLAKLRPGAEETAARSPQPAVALPVRMSIPAIGVNARFEYVGQTADGAMDVPKDPRDVAWYSLGPRPGELGNAVVAGHVDWGGKLAVFWGLKQLKAGNSVEVVAADGRKYEFIVQWVRQFDPAQASVQEVFRQSNDTELTLITCGGVFDHQTRQYLSREVVRAILK